MLSYFLDHTQGEKAHVFYFFDSILGGDHSKTLFVSGGWETHREPIPELHLSGYVSLYYP